MADHWLHVLRYFFRLSLNLINNHIEKISSLAKEIETHVFCYYLSSWKSYCVMFSPFKDQSLDLLWSTPKFTVLLVLGGCSGDWEYMWTG